MTATPQTLTQLLSAWSDGDKAALEQLMPLVYQELHRLAARHLARERPGHTLQATALVNEAYLRLIDQKRLRWQNKALFLAIAAHMMRRILVDYARARRYAKRGGGAPVVTLDEAGALSVERASDLIAVDDALTRLSERIRKIDPAGIISTVAGNGQRGFSGDGGPAVDASLDLMFVDPNNGHPYLRAAGGIALDNLGNLYIADT